MIELSIRYSYLGTQWVIDFCWLIVTLADSILQIKSKIWRMRRSLRWIHLFWLSSNTKPKKGQLSFYSRSCHQVTDSTWPTWNDLFPRIKKLEADVRYYKEHYESARVDLRRLRNTMPEDSCEMRLIVCCISALLVFHHTLHHVTVQSLTVLSLSKLCNHRQLRI